MVLFSTIASRLTTIPELSGALTQHQLLAFFEVSTRFTEFIPPANPGNTSRPQPLPSLPDNIALVLSLYTGLALEHVSALWGALGDIIMSARPGELIIVPGTTDEFLSAIGPSHNVGVEIMISAQKTCTTTGCSRHGKHLGCRTTYRPNYSVRNAQDDDAKRCYYAGMPNVLEISERSYVEKELVGLFQAQMCFAQ
ncbi:hypothetical protein C8T65DRAFT_691377 [Cerioporus squamosus]|nr:hypothetical protein C8T65DRAFT_691377 [Cerioporus squamosus]